MRYWDTSALIPILVSEPGSDLVDAWLRTDDAVCTWALTRVELASAVEHRAREGSIGVAQRRDALRAITDLADAASEVLDVESVRARAVSLLARHALRAADAAQLAAALVVVEGGVRGLPFVCFDRRLSDAASREGFEVLSWEE